MPPVSDLFDVALRDEPSPRLQADDIVHAARRRRSRRRATVAVSGAAVTVAAAVVLVGAFASGTTPAPDGSATSTPPAAAPGRTASSPRPAVKPALTAWTLPGLVQRSADMTLKDAQAIAYKRPAGALGVGGAVVRVAGRPAHQEDFELIVDPTGGEMLDSPHNCRGNVRTGYRGPCQVRSLPGGATLIVRSGAVKGGFRITSAVLIRRDRVVVSALCTNQLYTPPDYPPGPGAYTAPIRSKQPPLSAERLGRLVRNIASLA